MTAFAETFFHVFLFCQLIALTIVTPVFAGGSITEEKDRGTLSFLQTSLLSNREIVMGKLAARVVFVLGLALTGLPVLAITLLFGGVDPDLLITSFAAAVMSTVSLAAFSFWQATRHDTLKAVLFSAFGWVWFLMVFALCCGIPTDGYATGTSPFILLFMTIREAGRGRIDLTTLALIHVLIHGLMALFFVILAMGNLRAMLLKQPKPMVKGPLKDPDPPFAKPQLADVELYEPPHRERTPLRYTHVPYIREEDPLLWKETYFGGKIPTFEIDMLKGCFYALLVAVTLPLLFGLFVIATSSDNPEFYLNARLSVRQHRPRGGSHSARGSAGRRLCLARTPAADARFTLHAARGSPTLPPREVAGRVPLAAAVAGGVRGLLVGPVRHRFGPSGRLPVHGRHARLGRPVLPHAVRVAVREMRDGRAGDDVVPRHRVCIVPAPADAGRVGSRGRRDSRTAGPVVRPLDDGPEPAVRDRLARDPLAVAVGSAGRIDRGSVSGGVDGDLFPSARRVAVAKRDPTIRERRALTIFLRTNHDEQDHRGAGRTEVRRTRTLVSGLSLPRSGSEGADRRPGSGQDLPQQARLSRRRPMWPRAT